MISDTTRNPVFRLTLICASPRRGGNTETLLDRAGSAAADAGATVSKIILNDLTIAPCQECAEPDRRGRCRFVDGMEEVYDALDDADGIILGSPVFFGTVSAQAKAMIDRFQCRWIKRRSEEATGRLIRGAFICVAATHRQDFFRNARAVVRNFFATIGAAYVDELFCGGMEQRGAALASQRCLDAASALGSRLVKQ